MGESNLLRLLACFFFATLTVCGTFIAFRLPFMASHIPPLPGAEEIIRAGGVIFGSYRYSLQLPAVWLSGIALGPFWGAVSQGMFLLLGLFFLPVFIDGGGLDYLHQPAFGYLLSLLPAAWLVGKLRGGGGFKRSWLAIVVAQIFVNLLGSLGAAFHQGFEPLLWLSQFRMASQLLPGQLFLITAISGFAASFDFLRTAFSPKVKA
ncbi:MAG TPA: hypothetical protein DD435_00785 [Cyanobacteria bacterium UBA8530]|nr:hypothetical protein [Cyanobacteria bacterium UBA8530]